MTHGNPSRLARRNRGPRDLPAEHAKAIAKSAGLEIARLVLGAGEQMHGDGYCSVRGPIVIHCLEGEVEVATPERRERLRPGQLLWLEGDTEHALEGILGSVVLLTIVLV